MKTRMLWRGCGCGCLVFLLLGAAFVAVAFYRLSQVPKTYPPVAQPIHAPNEARKLGGGLKGFDSPYLGHTGSWDGKGGTWGGGSRIPDLDVERSMGLRWTFMPVYWRAMEPDGPVDLAREIPPAWQALDAFVIAAQQRGLNILMQAPVVGGNAGGPPHWAGRRQPGKSAPANMDAAAEFAGKLASRYAPNGVLATRYGWGDRFGVRAWEMDNEPESYRTNWKGQAADYAEFVTKVAARIRSVDPGAVILTPGIAGGGGGSGWLAEALDAERMAGSPVFHQNGIPFSVGKATEVVSFHCYEGLETAFSGQDRTLERDFSDVRAVFEQWEKQKPPFGYDRKQEYWHTEGNFDFLGILSSERRAAWRWQFFARGFAAGIRKLMVMDASPREQVSVRAFIEVLPNPFPMLPADKEISVLKGQAVAFRHPEKSEPDSGRVWVIWAVANSGPATIDLPAVNARVQLRYVDGSSETRPSLQGRLRVELKGDAKMPPPVLVVDRK